MKKLVLTLKRWQIALMDSLLLLLLTWLTHCLLVLIYFTQSSTFQNFYKGKKVKDDEFMLIPVNENLFIKNCGIKPF